MFFSLAFQYICHPSIFFFFSCSLWSDARVAGWWIEEVGESGFPDSAPSSALEYHHGLKKVWRTNNKNVETSASILVLIGAG